MLKGFDNETSPLSEYEKNTLLPLFLKSLPSKKGSRNSITSVEIIRRLRNDGYRIEGPRVRKIINYIRTNRLIKGIVATSDGYYIAEKKEEMDDYIDSLKGRLDAIRAVIHAADLDRREMFANGSPDLFSQ